MSDVILRLVNLTKRYPSRDRLAVSIQGELAIHRGEVFAVVGPSGAGKSTLLRMMAMIEPPSSGFVEFLGARYDAGTSPSLHTRRRVVYLFQQPQLLTQSVFDNVAYGLRVRGERNAAQRIQQALEQVGMSHLRHADARTLSGGEAQRVALARAFVIEPDALLLDEPTANLDPSNVGVIESVIRQLNDKGTTLGLVTHNVFQAKRLAHRVSFMLDGSIVEVAQVQQFFESPGDGRTAAFVRGEMVY